MLKKCQNILFRKKKIRIIISKHQFSMIIARWMFVIVHDLSQTLNNIKACAHTLWHRQKWCLYSVDWFGFVAQHIDRASAISSKMTVWTHNIGSVRIQWEFFFLIECIANYSEDTNQSNQQAFLLHKCIALCKILVLRRLLRVWKGPFHVIQIQNV